MRGQHDGASRGQGCLEVCEARCHHQSPLLDMFVKGEGISQLRPPGCGWRECARASLLIHPLNLHAGLGETCARHRRDQVDRRMAQPSQVEAVEQVLEQRKRTAPWRAREQHMPTLRTSLADQPACVRDRGRRRHAARRRRPARRRPAAVCARL